MVIPLRRLPVSTLPISSCSVTPGFMVPGNAIVERESISLSYAVAHYLRRKNKAQPIKRTATVAASRNE